MKPASEKEGISVNLTTDLIEILDDYCSDQDLTRSQVIAKALRTYLAIQYSSNGSIMTILRGARQHGKL